MQMGVLLNGGCDNKEKHVLFRQREKIQQQMGWKGYV